MRRAVLPVLGLGCFLVLLLVCYRQVLFEDGQFAYRDAATFYYPLYLRVQQEWRAGRWPLWDPGQNGGEPLLGNPMAAVLYPGKVLYAVLPYAWAARVYVIAHTIIAFWGLLALGRSCGVSWVGSCLGGLSYAFGALPGAVPLLQRDLSGQARPGPPGASARSTACCARGCGGAGPSSRWSWRCRYSAATPKQPT